MRQSLSALHTAAKSKYPVADKKTSPAASKRFEAEIALKVIGYGEILIEYKKKGEGYINL
jgi:hypothetical protein